MNLFIDIETLPTARADVREYIANTIKPPGTISKAETIAKWNEEGRPGAVEEAVAKTGLDGSFGRVCVIGWALDDGHVHTVADAENERKVLESFANLLSIPASKELATAVIGHNVSSFDLRFLVQRYIVNGIRPPIVIHRAAQAKPWESEKVFDTMIQWAGVGKTISLERLCLALSIPTPKGDITGATVAAAVAAGRIDEVTAYCVRDVEATREAYRRMTFSVEAA